MRVLFALSFLACLDAPASAQIVNPADKQRPPTQGAELTDPQSLPPTVVRGLRVSDFSEEDRIGPYQQPEWTAYRRFPSTRIYVKPPGRFGFEYWKRVKIPEHGSTQIETQYEFEIGLPGRFQVDMYLVHNQDGNEGNAEVNGQKLEFRWALADWDEIWGNPTLYFEVVNNDDEPDVLEYKLLFGGEMSPGWHWGSNLVLEHQTGAELENEYELTLGVSRTMRDAKWSLGAEMKAAVTDTHEDRGDYEESLEIGPSLQYRPFPNVHLDVAPLIGIGSNSRDADLFFVLGYDF